MLVYICDLEILVVKFCELRDLKFWYFIIFFLNGCFVIGILNFMVRWLDRVGLMVFMLIIGFSGLLFFIMIRLREWLLMCVEKDIICFRLKELMRVRKLVDLEFFMLLIWMLKFFIISRYLDDRMSCLSKVLNLLINWLM